MWELAARIEDRLLMLSAQRVIQLVHGAFGDRPVGTRLRRLPAPAVHGAMHTAVRTDRATGRDRVR